MIIQFKEIGEILGKDPSTISKEVRNHYKIVEKVHTIHVPTDVPVSITVTSANPVRSAGARIVRNVIHLAILTVLIFEEQVCLKIKKPPYVCNGCDTRQGVS